MAQLNTVVVSGNATRDPEVRWLSDEGDKAIVNFGVAVNRRRKDNTGEYVEDVSFFDIEVFGAFAVLVAKKVKRGDSVAIQGRLEQQKWEKDGESKSKVVIVAEQIDSEAFFRSKDEDNAVAVGTPPQAAAAPAPAAEPAPAAAPAADDIPF